MKTEINIREYLSEDDIRAICKEEVASKIRTHLGDEKNMNRVLSNLSYQMVFDEADKHLGTSAIDIIQKNTLKVINNISNYAVFRDNQYGGLKSKATNIMEMAVVENSDLIKSKVKEAIVNKDFSDEVWTKFEQLSEDFASNIYELVNLARSK